jgi:rare lipoprotein A
MGRSFPRIANISARVAFIAGAAMLLAACNATTGGKNNPYGVTASPRIYNDGDPIPKGNGRYHVGKPYVIAGVTYVPQENPDYRAEGIASWYGDAFHGRLTSNGEIFDMRTITAAHPTLPLPSYVRVTNLSNGRSLIVRVNDRGPFHANRVIDVSVRAADLLGFKSQGTARVRVEYVGKARLEGSDDQQLAATLRHDGPARAPQIRLAQQQQLPFVQPPQDTPHVLKRQPAPATVQPQRAANAPVAAPTAFSPASLSGRGLY